MSGYKISILSFFVVSVISMFAIGALILSKRVQYEPGVSLQESFQNDLGWNSKELPLGATELESDSTIGALQFDEWAHREFFLNGESFQLLIFRWYPGSASIARLAGHTPDVCWGKSGWSCLKRIEDKRIPIDSRRAFFPVQERLMQNRSNERWVYFFPVMNGQVYDHSKVYINEGLNTLLSPIRFGLSINQEKYFVRITSEQPIEFWLEKPQFQQLMESISKLTQGSVDNPS